MPGLHAPSCSLHRRARSRRGSLDASSQVSRFRSSAIGEARARPDRALQFALATRHLRHSRRRRQRHGNVLSRCRVHRRSSDRGRAGRGFRAGGARALAETRLSTSSNRLLARDPMLASSTRPGSMRPATSAIQGGNRRGCDELSRPERRATPQGCHRALDELSTALDRRLISSSIDALHDSDETKTFADAVGCHGGQRSELVEVIEVFQSITESAVSRALATAWAHRQRPQ